MCMNTSCHGYTYSVIQDFFLAVRSICKTMGMKCLHNERLGSALAWALRSKVKAIYSNSILESPHIIPLCHCVVKNLFTGSQLFFVKFLSRLPNFAAWPPLGLYIRYTPPPPRFQTHRHSQNACQI